MDTTTKLLQVFLADKQLRGLTGRLRAAERFLAEQDRQLADISAKADSVGGQIRQLSAVVAERELEMKSLDEKIEQLRERMNTSKTNKEYQALLTEVNTYKTNRSELESEALEHMGKIDELKASADELSGGKDERTKMREVAEGDRSARESEIREQVETLKQERARLAEEAPRSAMSVYDERWAQFDDEDEVMAPVEEQDRKRGEYTCGACMMAIPIESVSALLSHGDLTQCVSCGVILYLESELSEALRDKAARAAKAKAKKAASTS
ncbi:MAG: hypothetical protein AAGK04_03940 [Planctomycetota bacterium]